MDNGGYIQDPEKGTELKLVESPTNRSPDYSQKAGSTPGTSEGSSPKSSNEPGSRSGSQRSSKQVSPKDGTSLIAPGSVVGGAAGSSAGGQPPEEPGPSTSCRPEVCQRARQRYTAPDLRGSPWHRSKTIFLLSTIGALIVWAIVYSTLSKLNIL